MADILLTLKRLWTLVVKELLAILKDPKSRVVVIGPPIVQFFVFGYAATYDLNHVRFAVRDEDRSAASRQLIADVAGSRLFNLVGELQSNQQIQAMLDRQDARLVIHIPQNFSRDLHAGKPVTVQVLLDGRNSNVASVALGYINGIVARYNQKQSTGVTQVISRASGQTAGTWDPPLAPVGRSWFNANFQSRWFIVSALSAEVTMIVVVLLTGLSVSREREFGTFDQLLVAPFRAGEILVGKAVPAMVLGMGDGLLLAAAATLWFGVPLRGSLIALVMVLAIFNICIVGVGLFISSLSSTMQQSLLGAFIFIMPAVILSGFTTPIENMPHWLQICTYINPLRYAVAASRDIFLQGGNTASIWPQLWPMALIAAATLSAATWLFRHRTE